MITSKLKVAGFLIACCRCIEAVFHVMNFKLSILLWYPNHMHMDKKGTESNQVMKFQQHLFSYMSKIYLCSSIST